MKKTINIVKIDINDEDTKNLIITKKKSKNLSIDTEKKINKKTKNKISKKTKNKISKKTEKKLYKKKEKNIIEDKDTSINSENKSHKNKNTEISSKKKLIKNIIEDKNILTDSKKESLKINNEYIFNNNFMLLHIEKNKNSKEDNIITELKKLIPSIDNDIILQLYNKSISIHQSKMQGNGNFLEDILIEFLEKNKISYKKQASIDKFGIINGFNDKKKCYHIIDFVIGHDIEIDKMITNFIIISCKTTCRERWTQDDWTFTIKPKLYILLTISNDYPSSNRFREDTNRKIITCNPKKRDDRKFKLNFEDLINEL